MTLRNVGFGGAGALAIGLFTPILTLPIVGNVNLFNNGSNWIAMILLALVALAGVLIVRQRFADVIWPGAAAAAILLFVFGRMQYGLSTMRESLSKELEGNPFAGIAQAAVGSIQFQWGWLVLAAGAGALIYTGVVGRKENGDGLTMIDGGEGRLAAALSALALVAAVAIDLIGRTTGLPASKPSLSASASDALVSNDMGTVSDAADGPTAQEAAYIRENLRLYDLDAKYFDSLMDGRVPGVRFKIQNNGDRTLNEVKVRVVFFDAAGKAIAEEEYAPVIVSEYNFGGDNKPLRPNYIWQEEPDKFFTAKNVPSEWAAGKVTAAITDIEFGPEE